VVVIDEKWLFAKPMPPKEMNRCWVEVGGDRPQQPHRVIADKIIRIMKKENLKNSYAIDKTEQRMRIVHNLYKFVRVQSICSSFLYTCEFSSNDIQSSLTDFDYAIKNIKNNVIYYFNISHANIV
jgi:hypothetical protein